MLKRFTGNPAYVLLFTQMFSTIAFAVLYSTLVLFMHQRLGISKSSANEVMGLFIAFNYGLHLLGGIVGGRFLSFRVLFILGMILQFAACLIFSLETTDSLFLALALYLTGSGLNVPCINMMLTQQFKAQSHERETSFIWNYAGMNLGFLAGFSLAGHFQLLGSFKLMFLITAITNVIASIIILLGWKAVKDHNTSLVSAVKYQAKQWYIRGLIGLLIIIALFSALTFLLQHAQATNNLMLGTALFMFLFFIFCGLIERNKISKHRIYSYVLLSLCGLVFWSLYQLAPMGLTLFAQYNVDRVVMGTLIPPQWIQNINAIIILSGGFILPPLFKKIRRYIEFGLPLQFALSLSFICIGFLMLPIGIHFASANGYVNFFWIAASYVFQAIGELFIGPIGYAMIGLLAPAHLQGVMMGSWMLLTGGASGVIASKLSNFALAESSSNNPLLTNAGYSHMFTIITVASGLVAMMLFALIPILRRMIARDIEV